MSLKFIFYVVIKNRLLSVVSNHEYQQEGAGLVQHCKVALAV